MSSPVWKKNIIFLQIPPVLRYFNPAPISRPTQGVLSYTQSNGFSPFGRHKSAARFEQRLKKIDLFEPIFCFIRQLLQKGEALTNVIAITNRMMYL